MSTRSFADFDRAPAGAPLQAGSNLQALPEDLSLEPPRYLSAAPSGMQDSLGCLRGVAIALGLQALLLVVGFAVWKLL